jgi:hypothetical protein
MTSLLHFIEIYQLVQKFMGGNTHRHVSDLISLLFSFKKESRLKIILSKTKSSEENFIINPIHIQGIIL